MDTRSTPTTPAPSSGSSAPSSPPSRLVCWGSTLTALGGMGLLGGIIWQALPWAMRMYEVGKDWKPLLGICVCVGMLVAPVDTLGLVKDVANRLLLRRPEK
jgi:hypothetical protein